MWIDRGVEESRGGKAKGGEDVEEVAVEFRAGRHHQIAVNELRVPEDHRQSRRGVDRPELLEERLVDSFFAIGVLQKIWQTRENTFRFGCWKTL